MALTQGQRDKMPAEHFAFPRTRQCPMPDAKHTKLAWDMIDNTKGVTDEERRSARSRVLRRAKELGMDTSEWTKIKAMAFDLPSLSAMSLEVPTTEDHPNKMAFSGVLTKVDEPSDLAPHGSYGRKVYIPSDVAASALPTLLGMAVDFKTDLSGHSRKNKIGIITAATIEGREVHISGFFYANDFPEEVSMIQANKEDLGFSFEAERILVASLEQDPLRIESLVFTGAAVLQKKKAAYQSTSLAAAAEEKTMEKEQFDAIMAAIGGLDTRIKKVEDARVEAASVADKVSTHAQKLHGIANDMEAAGIGCDPTTGHAHILHHMADSMMAEAHKGAIPSSYRGISMYGSAALPRVDAAAEEARKKEIDDLKKQITTLSASLDDEKTKLKDLQAKADKGFAPDRKTLPPRISALMAKGAITLPDDGTKLTIGKLDAALKGTSLTPQDRIEIKIGLERAGLLEKAAA